MLEKAYRAIFIGEYKQPGESYMETPSQGIVVICHPSYGMDFKRWVTIPGINGEPLFEAREEYFHGGFVKI